jgi:protein-tyrosine-phosphatase
LVVGTTLSKHFRGPLAAGLPSSELRIKAAWRIVHSAREQFEKARAIDPERLEVMRRVQLDVAMHLAKVEDGHAILYTEWSTRRSLRHIEQAATNLISMTTLAEPE